MGVVRWGVGFAKQEHTHLPFTKNFFSLSFQAVVSSRENFYLCMSKMCSLNELKAEQDERFLSPWQRTKKELIGWRQPASSPPLAPKLSPCLLPAS